METNNHNDESNAAEPTKKANTAQPIEAIIWWAMLVLAIIAIPTGGAIIAMVLPFGGIAQLAAFAIGCWLCTWVGMWLMHHSKRFDQK